VGTRRFSPLPHPGHHADGKDYGYEDDFVPFVEQFKSLFATAAAKSREILIFVG
jgi:hypothetical protein